MEQLVSQVALAIAFYVSVQAAIQESLVLYVLDTFFFTFSWLLIIYLSLVNQCSTNPCLNGGTCQSTSSGYVCQCSSFYSGANCQICN